MGNAASSGGKWDLTHPQPKWAPKKKVDAAPRSLWLANKKRNNGGSNSNDDDDWYIFKKRNSPASPLETKNTKR